VIDEIYAEWECRTTEKQRITGTLLHNELRKRGFEVGLTSIRAWSESESGSDWKPSCR